MKFDTVLLIVAVVAVIVSLVGAGITYNYVTAFRSKLTGFASDTAIVNLTVTQSVAVNFTIDKIEWGRGNVNISAGCTYAILETNGTVWCGNWTSVSDGMYLENIGNVNVTLDLACNETAANFIGGTAPSYQYNVTRNSTSSCVNGTDAADAFPLGAYQDVNVTGVGTRICSQFNYDTNHDSIRIDLKVQVPSNSKTGTRHSKWTATAASV